MELVNQRILELKESNRPELAIPMLVTTKLDSLDGTARSEAKIKTIPSDTEAIEVVGLPFEATPPDIDSKRGYLKVGFGRYASPLAKFRIGPKMASHKRDWSLRFDHFSAHKDAVSLREFRQEALGFDYAKILASGKRNTLHFDGFNSTNFLYGNAEGSNQPATILRDSLRRNQTRLAFGGVYHIEAVKGLAVNFGVKDVFANRKRNEFQVQVAPIFSRKLSTKLSLDLGGNMQWFANRAGTSRYGRGLFELNPLLSFVTQRFKAKVGVYLGHYRGGQTAVRAGLIAPIAELRYQLLPETMVAYAGVKGGINPNSLYDFLSQNPYLIVNPNLQASKEKYNIYLGADSKILQKMDWAIQGYYRRLGNQAMFLRSNSEAGFAVVYDSLIKNLGLKTSLNYHLTKALRLGATVSYNNYKLATQKAYFHAPTWQSELLATYRKNRLSIGTSLFLLGKTPMGLSPNGNIVSRKVIPDLNLNADYRVYKNLTVYVDLRNVLSRQYATWNGYNNRPIDYRAGLTWVF